MWHINLTDEEATENYDKIEKIWYVKWKINMSFSV